MVKMDQPDEPVRVARAPRQDEDATASHLGAKKEKGMANKDLWNKRHTFKRTSKMIYKFRAFDKKTLAMVFLDPLQWPLTALNESEDWKVMMWTGLTDRHGKEIWEGDVVKKHGSVSRDDPTCGSYEPVYEVQWTDDYACFTLVGYSPCGGMLAWLELEVVGNIYENPELLK